MGASLRLGRLGVALARGLRAGARLVAVHAARPAADPRPVVAVALGRLLVGGPADDRAVRHLRALLRRQGSGIGAAVLAAIAILGFVAVLIRVVGLVGLVGRLPVASNRDGLARV